MNFALSQVLFWIPAIILSLIGIAVAAIQFSRHPVPSTLVLVACLLSLVRAIAIPLLQGLGASGTFDNGRQWHTLISAFGTLTSAVTFILMLVAVYSGRRNSTESFANQNPYGETKPVVLAEFAQSHRDARR